MSKNKKSNKSESQLTLQNESMGMCGKFTLLFVISMFTLFPIFMTDKLFKVRTDRLYYFMISTFALLFFILATYICGIDKNTVRRKIYSLTFPDICMLAFLAVCALSSLFSEYGMESVTGESGRNSGLILMAVYVLCYFLITRFFECKSFIFDIFIVTASLISLLAVLNEFYVDPFGIFTLIKEEQQDMFITTIGNKNMFSAFVCITLPVAVVMLIKAKDWATTVFYSIACGIGFMGLIVADSDSGYFGIGAFMLLMLIYACGSADRMFRYSLSIFSMLLSCKILRLISLIFNDKMKELDTIPMTLVFSNQTYFLIASAAIVTIFFFLLSRKFGDTHTPKFVRIIAICLVVVCMLAVLLPFLYFSFIDTATELGGLEKYLRLNDKWGTHRGYAWIRSIILFKNNGIKNSLIGCGPDTFGQIMNDNYHDDMVARHHSVFDSAHNEYLNYLVTIGLLGLIAYVGAIASILYRCVKAINKKAKDTHSLLIIVFVIISYCSQALFNLATPIITPYIFLFLAMGEAIVRRNEFQNTPAQKENIKNKKK